MRTIRKISEQISTGPRRSVGYLIGAIAAAAIPALVFQSGLRQDRPRVSQPVVSPAVTQSGGGAGGPRRESPAARTAVRASAAVAAERARGVVVERWDQTSTVTGEAPCKDLIAALGGKS